MTNRCKNVGIVTLFGNVNYGNRLQNYAVQVVIDKLGLKATTIDYQEYANSFIPRTKAFIKSYLHRLLGLLRLSTKTVSKINYSEADTIEEMELIKLRKESFAKFNSKYIRTVTIANTLMIYTVKAKMNFDWFVIGSDQVWNPIFGAITPFKFASFTKRHRRVAYAASFGVSSIPTNLKKDYEAGLTGISCISVREDAAALIVKELTGKSATVVIDPTMMLDGTEWRTVSEKDKNRPGKPYILSYFLGEDCSELDQTIAMIKKSKDIEVIKLNDKSDGQRYTVGPGAFIDYIDHAELVLTDSFHGTVFSILLGRPFLVFDRAHMNSRIDTLLNKFGLEHRKHGVIRSNEDLFSMDYSHVNDILIRERNKALVFLSGALKLEDPTI